MPALLKSEGRRSLKMIPGEFVHQTRETPFALFVVNCCMDPPFDSKRYYDTTGRTLYLTNTALTAGVEITDARIAAYRAAREGDKDPFASGKSPRQEARDSVFTTSSFCCVSVDNKQNMVGNCSKCMKKMGWNCPSVINVRKLIVGFPDNEDPRTLMSVYAGNIKKNGNSQSEFLSGKKCVKSKAPKRSALLHDPSAWLAQRNNKFLYETCLALLILPKRKKGATNPSKFRERPELIKQLLALADNPKAFRKNQDNQRQFSADREMGAYGYSDFTTVLYEKTGAQKKLKQELGFTKSNSIEEDSSCEGKEEGFAEKKNNSGKPLPFITQDDSREEDDDEL